MHVSNKNRCFVFAKIVIQTDSIFSFFFIFISTKYINVIRKLEFLENIDAGVTIYPSTRVNWYIVWDTLAYENDLVQDRQFKIV